MKPLCIVSCPIDTFSGYGARSRDFVKALIEVKGKKWEIKISPQKWGDCPWNYLSQDDPLRERFVSPTLKRRPDVWIQITVPNEFQPIGTAFNVGISAGIETTIYPAEFLEGMNKMDLNLVSSEHSKNVALNSGFEKRNQQTNQVERVIKLEKPCEERKPALILKTNEVNYSILDREAILKKINNLRKEYGTPSSPSIYLLHGEMTDEEMNQLNNEPKVKSFISFTKGEGFGRPLLEASITGKPIITTNWSGHIDFINPRYNILIGGELKNVHSSSANQFLLKESQWFNINTKTASKAMKDLFKHYKKYIAGSRKQTQYIKDNFSFEKMVEKLKGYMPELKPTTPTTDVPLNLPKLKKVGEKNELPKLKLPKLKKIEA
jgi:hypothetical protein